MGCSCAGFTSIILTTVSLIFAAISLGLPYWTVDKTSIEDQIDAVQASLSYDYNVGVWGICNNVKVDFQDIGESRGQCYFFYSGSVDGFIVGNNGAITVDSYDGSICDLYAEASPFFEAMNYFGIPKSNFNEFMDRSCGSIGKTTIAFTVITVILPVIMLVMLSLGVTCCKKNSFMNVISMWLGVLAFISSVVSFSMWLHQSNPIDGSLSWGFALEVITAFLFGLTTFSIYRHVRKARFENKPNQELAQHLDTSAPMPASSTQGTNLV